MQQLIILITMCLGVAMADVKTYRWIGPDGQAVETFTGSVKHQALMDAWMTKKCKMEKPVRQAYTTEEWKAMTPEERQTAKAFKIKRTKWTDSQTGIEYGDDREYTVLAESPLRHLDDDPNDVIDMNEAK